MSSTNLQSNEATAERKKVGMALPPPILLAICLIVGLVVQTTLIGPIQFSVVRLILGGIVAVLSLGIIISSGRRFRRAGTPVRPVAPTTTIVASGPYKFSRNPMYLGMAGILASGAIITASYALVLSTVVFIIGVHFGVILREERYLENLHGATYMKYKSAVRRWI
jgi:protein-S-isoprenylcysteine O-methyltransferase Ste14